MYLGVFPLWFTHDVNSADFSSRPSIKWIMTVTDPDDLFRASCSDFLLWLWTTAVLLFGIFNAASHLKGFLCMLQYSTWTNSACVGHNRSAAQEKKKGSCELLLVQGYKTEATICVQQVAVKYSFAITKLQNEYCIFPLLKLTNARVTIPQHSHFYPFLCLRSEGVLL